MKNANDIFEQVYITPNDLKIIIPSLGINACRSLIKTIAQEERERGAYIPFSKPTLAPTKAVRKKLKI